MTQADALDGRMTSRSAYRLGVDVGGTKIEAVSLSPTGEERFRARVPTPKPELLTINNDDPQQDAPSTNTPPDLQSPSVLEKSYRATLQAIAELVNRAAAAVGNSTTHSIPVGIGIPGAVDAQTGLVKNANSTWLIGRPMVEDLSAMLRRPVRVSNDANCFALSEWADGAGELIAAETGARPAVLWGVILGTGVGSGIVVNGRIIEGANRIGGEWGHNPLPHMTPDEIATSPKCYCGADAFRRAASNNKASGCIETGCIETGCIETWCSGPALERDFAQSLASHPSASRIPPLRATQIAAIAESDVGDHVTVENTEQDIVIDDALRSLASDAIDRLIDRLGRAVAGVINILDPDVIVLGGGVGRIERLYDPAHGVLAKATPWVFSATGGGAAHQNLTNPGNGIDLRTRIVPPVHGDSSGVRGAARLWDE